MAAEKQLEQKIKTLCEKNSVLYYKFVSPGNDGVPDRILVFPNSLVSFVELKAPGAQPRPLQRHQMAKLKKNGADVHVFDDYDLFEQWFLARAMLP